MVKVKFIPQHAEVAQRLPVILRPRIFLTFGTTRVEGSQPYAPADFTAGEIPSTNFQALSRPQGTWFHRETWKKSPVTPPRIDPGTSRLVAQCINHYATPAPKEAHNMTINQLNLNPVSHPQAHHKSCVTPSHITNPVSHPQSLHKSCVKPTVSSQILCHTHSLITHPVTPTVSSQILGHTHSLITNPVSHPQSHHKHINIGRIDLQTCLFHGNGHSNQIHNIQINNKMHFNIYDVFYSLNSHQYVQGDTSIITRLQRYKRCVVSLPLLHNYKLLQF